MHALHCRTKRLCSCRTLSPGSVAHSPIATQPNLIVALTSHGTELILIFANSRRDRVNKFFVFSPTTALLLVHFVVRDEFYRYRGKYTSACSASVRIYDWRGWTRLVLKPNLHILLQYDLSASQFSPDGRVFQVEYAHKAVENGGWVPRLRIPSVSCMYSK